MTFGAGGSTVDNKTVEIAKKIAHKLGKELEIKDTDFDSIINEVKSGYDYSQQIINDFLFLVLMCVKEEIHKNFDLTPDKETVLFFAGGEFGLGRNNTVMMLKVLIRLFKDLQVVAISGKNRKMKKKFQEKEFIL